MGIVRAWQGQVRRAQRSLPVQCCSGLSCWKHKTWLPHLPSL